MQIKRLIVNCTRKLTNLSKHCLTDFLLMNNPKHDLKTNHSPRTVVQWQNLLNMFVLALFYLRAWLSDFQSSLSILTDSNYSSQKPVLMLSWWILSWKKMHISLTSYGTGWPLAHTGNSRNLSKHRFQIYRMCRTDSFSWIMSSTL